MLMAVKPGDSEPELNAILLRGYESKDLDYKGPMSWNENDKEACCALVKDILGMANTEGGFIVVGVSERPGGFAWDGLSPEQSKTFDTSRLNQFLQNCTDPPINALLRKIDHDGKNFLIIEVPAFPDTPHNVLGTARRGIHPRRESARPHRDRRSGNQDTDRGRSGTRPATPAAQLSSSTSFRLRSTKPGLVG
jgi:predicted HTH transcriptional regulator